jgi:hypothetical protein
MITQEYAAAIAAHDIARAVCDDVLVVEYRAHPEAEVQYNEPPLWSLKGPQRYPTLDEIEKH